MKNHLAKCKQSSTNFFAGKPQDALPGQEIHHHTGNCLYSHLNSPIIPHKGRCMKFS